MIHEKFCVGVVLGTQRSARWSRLRRLLYLVGSPLIPIVLFVRVLRGARHWPSGRLPAGAIAGVLISAVSKTAGEIAGYAGVRMPAAAATLQIWRSAGAIRRACGLMTAARGTLPVRVGLIGCGTIAYWSHLRTLRQLRGVTLAAAADPDPAARARAASMVRGPIHDQLSDLLLDDIDAVVISAPNRFHAGYRRSRARRQARVRREAAGDHGQRGSHRC